MRFNSFSMRVCQPWLTRSLVLSDSRHDQVHCCHLFLCYQYQLWCISAHWQLQYVSHDCSVALMLHSYPEGQRSHYTRDSKALVWL